MQHHSTSLFTAETLVTYCNHLGEKDAVLQRIIYTHGYPPFWNRKPGFGSLIHIILEQQVSLASALAAFTKLQEALPVLDALSFLQLDDDTLRACYFSRQKMVYARHLATLITTGELDLELLQHADDATVSAQLKKVKGIGDWTANIYLMMALQRVDVFPLNDIALNNSIKHEYNMSIIPARDEIEKISSQWKPYRTMAAYLLWHAYLQRRKKLV